MQSNLPAASGTSNNVKSVFIIVFIGFAMVCLLAPIIFFESIFYLVQDSLPYKKRTAKAKPEIIKITPTSWSESRSGSKPGQTYSTKEEGYIVSYKFTTANGQPISTTDSKHSSNTPESMAQVCYEPNQPYNSGLNSEGNCF